MDIYFKIMSQNILINNKKGLPNNEGSPYSTNY